MNARIQSALLAAMVATGAAAAAVPVDELVSRLEREMANAARQGRATLVNDYAGVMAAGRRERLETLLRELDRKTGVQVAVVALPSLEGGEINDFAVRLFEAWGIGGKAGDTGVLLVAALRERRVRIETGYGMEELIPDARAGRILDEHVLPRFREEAYGEGLAAGAEAVAVIVARNAGVSLTAAPAPAPPRPRSPGTKVVSVLILLLLLPLFIRNPFLFLLLLGGPRGGFGGGGFSGGGFGGFGGGMSGGGGATRGW